MNGFIQGFAALGLWIGCAERCGRQHAEGTGEHGGHIRQHIAEEIIGDDHVILLGPAHQLHGAIISQHMLECGLGIFSGVNAGDHFMPEHTGFHHIAFLG